MMLKDKVKITFLFILVCLFLHTSTVSVANAQQDPLAAVKSAIQAGLDGGKTIGEVVKALVEKDKGKAGDIVSAAIEMMMARGGSGLDANITAIITAAIQGGGDATLVVTSAILSGADTAIVGDAAIAAGASVDEVLAAGGTRTPAVVKGATGPTGSIGETIGQQGS